MRHFEPLADGGLCGPGRWSSYLDNARAAELWGRKPAIGDTDERFAARTPFSAGRLTPWAHCDTPVALALSTGASVHEDESS